MRQSREIAIADQYQNRADTAVESNLTQIQSEWVIKQRAREYRAFADAGRLAAPLKQYLDNYGGEEYAVRYMRMRVSILHVGQLPVSI